MWYIWAVGLSSLGTGLVFPLTAVYLSGIDGIGVAGTAIYFGILAGANIGISAILSVKRFNANYAYISGAGCCLATLGFIGISATNNWPLLVLFAVIVGVGQGGSSATLTAVMALMVEDTARREFFGRRYRAMNIGIGLGAALGSIVSSWLPPNVLPVMFLLNGFSYLPLAILLLIYGCSDAWITQGNQSTRKPTADSLSSRSRVTPNLMALGTVNLLAMVFAVSQLEVSAPLISIRLLGINPVAVGAMVVVNTAGVVLLFNPTVRLLRRFDETMGVLIAGFLWAASYFLMAVFSLANPNIAALGLVLFALVFALGEIAFSYSYQPLLVREAGDVGSAQAGALANLFGNIGDVIGPIIGVSIIGLGSAWVSWFALGIGCFCMVILLPYKLIKLGIS
ncbi:MFS transporter [Mycobacteroides abscessus]